MNGNTMPNLGGIVDVALGMSFTYLLLSLVCSGCNEFVAWVLRLRANSLRTGIDTLLADEALPTLAQKIYEHPLIRSISHRGPPSYIPSTSFVLSLLDTLCDLNLERAELLAALRTGLVKLSPGMDGYARLESLQKELSDRPSEAGIWSFANVQRAVATLAEVVEQLPDGEGKQILAARLDSRQSIDSLDGIKNLLATLPATSRLRRQLELFLDDGVKTATEYRQRLEAWFDHGMDRLTGVYKRRAQVISIVIGLLLSFAVGVDSWVVSNALMRDGALRQATVAAAVEASKHRAGAVQKNATDERIAAREMATTVEELDELKLPIGWPYLAKSAPAGNAAPYWLWRALGIIFTGLAVALGAPFWFEVVGKLINLRSSGPSPQKVDSKG
jgi:hypothetical protein